MKPILFLVLAATLTTTRAAQDKPLALKGFDPVALCEGAEVPGEASIVQDFGRHTYRFVSEESLATFREEPERYAIQWGGACGRMGPLSGRGSADRWAIVDERIYVFASDGCREGFLADTSKFLTEATRPRAGDAKRGRALIDVAVAAHGGPAAVDAAAAMRLTSQAESSDWLNEVELVVAADGSILRRSIWSPPSEDQNGFDTVWACTDEDAFTVESGTVFDLTSHQERVDVRRYAHREILGLLWARTREDFRAVEVEEREVDVTFDGLTTTLHVGEDGTIEALSWTGRLNDGVTREIRETFTEWAVVDGVRLPTTRKILTGGKETVAGPWTIELLEKAPTRAFDRP